MSPIDQTEVSGLDMARSKSTLNTPAIATSATSGWFQGEVVELTDVHLGDGDWIRSLTALTTQAPAPYLGQFVEADTEVDLGGNYYYLVRLASDGSRRILDDTLAVTESASSDVA